MNATARHIGCLLIPHFGLACELADRPDFRDMPVVLGGGDAGPQVLDCSPQAAAWGIDPGISLREASALCPSLVVLEPRTALYERAWDEIGGALQQVSPAIERERPGVAYLDLAGLGALYGEELPALVLGCAPTALQPRFGMAPGKFPAFVAASEAAPGESRQVAEAELVEFLAARSIELLPLDHATRRWLHLLGIASLGQLAALPRHAVQAEFGAHGDFIWRLASGLDDRPVLPELYVERAIETMEFAASPLVTQDAILTAMKSLLVRILRQPAVRNRFVRSLTVTAVTERGRTWRRLFTLKEPSGDRDRLWRVIRTLISYAEFPGPVSELRLELHGFTRESGHQTKLFRKDARVQEELEETLRQLKARYGLCPVSKVVEMEPWSRVPERRLALVDFDP